MLRIPSFVRRALRRPPKRRPPSSLRAWSIGIYAGPSPYLLGPAPGVENPVLTREHVTDVPALLVADPFMLEVDAGWYMFFEVMNARTAKGEVGLAVSDDTVRWKYHGIVLDEPFHLSYPYVFEWMGAYYMIPESHEAGAVRLYRARRFPFDWVYVETLLTGKSLVDSSVVNVDGHWWMFGQNSPMPRHDTLRLYGAEALTGPWREHPASPIVAGDPHAARPAGRVVLYHDRIVRFAQDCHAAYGLAVRAFEVGALTATAYEERPIGPDPMLAGSGVGWSAGGMHHVDPHRLADGQWVAAVDGWSVPDDNARSPGPSSALA